MLLLAGRAGLGGATVARRPSVLAVRQVRALSAVADGPQFRLELLSGENKGVALFTLARPAARNALGRQMMAEFNQAMDTVRFDPSVRVVVVQSTVPKGKIRGSRTSALSGLGSSNGSCSLVFCAGADLKERAQMTQQEVRHFLHVTACCESMLTWVRLLF